MSVPGGTPSSPLHGSRPPKEHGTRQEVLSYPPEGTWYQTHPCKQNDLQNLLKTLPSLILSDDSHFFSMRNQFSTRKHSSRMCTARLPTVRTSIGPRYQHGEGCFPSTEHVWTGLQSCPAGVTRRPEGSPCKVRFHVWWCFIFKWGRPAESFTT